MKKEELILVGGGGHCKSCIDVIESEGRFNIKGIIDVPEKSGMSIFDYPVIGSDDDLAEWSKRGYNFLITLGHMGNSSRRRALFNIIKLNGGYLPVIISPLAYVSKYSYIKEGTIIMHHCMVNANVSIGENSIMNSKALLEHDVVVGDDCHVSTGVLVNGNCTIGNNVFIGSGSIIKNGIGIIDTVVIGTGSNVVKDIEISGIYVGNPVKLQK